MAASFQGFRSLIENSPDAISLIDMQGEILYGSASTTKILGYHPEELLGRNCLELIHPEDRYRSSRALRDVLPSRQVHANGMHGSAVKTAASRG
jgi:PAS domain S-box-containing protein